MAFAIPDVPREISVQISREKLLATEALYESDLARLKRESEAHTLGMNGENKTSVRRGSRVAQDSFLTQIQHSMELQQQQTQNRLNNQNGNPQTNVDLNSLHLD